MKLLDKELKPTGELQQTANRDHDLVNELSERLDTLCEYAERVANSDDHPEMQETWRELEQREQENIHRLKGEIIDRIEQGVFLHGL